MKRIAAILLAVACSALPACAAGNIDKTYVRSLAAPGKTVLVIEYYDGQGKVADRKGFASATGFKAISPTDFRVDDKLSCTYSGIEPCEGDMVNRQEDFVGLLCRLRAARLATLLQSPKVVFCRAFVTEQNAPRQDATCYGYYNYPGSLDSVDMFEEQLVSLGTHRVAKKPDGLQCARRSGRGREDRPRRLRHVGRPEDQAAMRGSASVTCVAAVFAGGCRLRRRPTGYFDLQPGVTLETGDSWIDRGQRYRLYGVQTCLRGTTYTDHAGPTSRLRRSVAGGACRLYHRHPSGLRADSRRADTTYVACYATIGARPARPRQHPDRIGLCLRGPRRRRPAPARTLCRRGADARGKGGPACGSSTMFSIPRSCSGRAKERVRKTAMSRRRIAAAPSAARRNASPSQPIGR